MCDAHMQAVYIRVMPIGAVPIQFRGAGLRDGIIYGLRQGAAAAKRLVDIKKVIKILDETGIRDDMARVLSLDTHKKLTGIINQLMEAAYSGGIEELNQTISKLALPSA
jgi:hypothetical protein